MLYIMTPFFKLAKMRIIPLRERCGFIANITFSGDVLSQYGGFAN